MLAVLLICQFFVFAFSDAGIALVRILLTVGINTFGLFSGVQRQSLTFALKVRNLKMCLALAAFFHNIHTGEDAAACAGTAVQTQSAGVQNGIGNPSNCSKSPHQSVRAFKIPKHKIAELSAEIFGNYPFCTAKR